MTELSEEEKKAIEFLKEKMKKWRKYMPEDKELHAEDIVINLIQKQGTEINKLKNVIDRMAEEYSLEANTDILDICACCNYNNEDCHGDYCKEALINYFTNKVEEDK